MNRSKEMLSKEFKYRNKGVVKGRILDAIADMTSAERTVAEFFLENEQSGNFSLKAVSVALFVSEATLSRFSKKCGYKGYREFVFDYEREISELRTSGGDISVYTRKVKSMYTDIFKKSFELLDEEQMERIARNLMDADENVYVYGMGSSGYAAEEFTYRFMRLGMKVQAVTDSHMMKASAALTGDKTLVIGISISGDTSEVVDALRIAKKNGAKVIFLTGKTNTADVDIADEVVELAYLKDLDNGTKISPQISPLILIDVLYSYYLSKNSALHFERYNETLSAIKDKKE